MYNELKHRSLRILLDLQPCQTKSSENRGVENYSFQLASNMIDSKDDIDLFISLTKSLPINPKLEMVKNSRIIRIPEVPDINTPMVFQGGEKETIYSFLISSFYAKLNPDIIHISHLFEHSFNPIYHPNLLNRPAGQILSATLYDIIPLKFESHYLKNQELRKWYLSRCSLLRKCDLLLSISESTRQDAINLLGIEPERIITIHGGVSNEFKPSNNEQQLKQELIKKYNLNDNFLVYTGGDDFRKNISGLIEGYARLPLEVQNKYQLVIICEISDNSKNNHFEKAKKLGLFPNQILFTGYIPYQDLISFYQSCDLFIFPSLYEGLGLPILEAMACGAPVIGGDNSSIKELIDRKDALFDAKSPDSIAETMLNVLKNINLQKDLRSYSLQRIKSFTWEKTSKKALLAFKEAAKQSRKNGIQTALSGWLPKKRLAVLTPLPPDRSGIADYNAEFLPYLSKHFNIDIYIKGNETSDEKINSTFRVFNHEGFDDVADNYGAILYEIGNSEYHDYMLPYLNKFPGIVGLHDAYLSGLIGYHCSQKSDPNCFVIEMINAHGSQARNYFAPIPKTTEPVFKAMVELPCTKGILDQAIGIVSHSPFNLEIARNFYPEGWKAPYRIIPQMAELPVEYSQERKSRTRKKLGFTDQDFLITTFGHIAWTKMGDVLLEAFQKSAMINDPNVHLIFAGKLAEDNFGEELRNKILSSDYSYRIHITGYLTDEEYEAYLEISNIGVQLRKNSRGGTPRGVLDCLLHKVPVLVNNDASYKDYPDDVVIKVSAKPSIEEISRKLEQLVSDKGRRESYSISGYDYVQKHHNPVACAAAYAAAIHEFIERSESHLLNKYISEVAPHISSASDPSAPVDFIDWLTSAPEISFKRPRLLLDVSTTTKTEFTSGIQRVVSKVVETLYLSKQTQFNPLAVTLSSGHLKNAKEWLNSNGLIPPEELEFMDCDENINLKNNDVILMLDSSWGIYQDFYPIFDQARDMSIPIYTVVYDILPILLPDCFVQGGSSWFKSWLHSAIESSDGLICISKSVAKELKKYIENNSANLPNSPKIGYWHLGSAFHDLDVNQPARSELKIIVKNPYLLMIGTLEPRENLDLALAALEEIWAHDIELNLVIAGRQGWDVENFIKKVHNHPKLNSSLFFVEEPSDYEVDYLYSHASGLLLISKGEGFGLPIIEAANYNLPIICSDIPVFHEIAGEYATYVSTENSHILSKALIEWLDKKNKSLLPETKFLPRLSWEESVEKLLKLITDQNWDLLDQF